jgi:hypothetical protein
MYLVSRGISLNIQYTQGGYYLEQHYCSSDTDGKGTSGIKATEKTRLKDSSSSQRVARSSSPRGPSPSRLEEKNLSELGEERKLSAKDSGKSSTKGSMKSDSTNLSSPSSRLAAPDLKVSTLPKKIVFRSYYFRIFTCILSSFPSMLLI